MGRPPKIPAPTLQLADAIAAAQRIRGLRAEAHDPDLDFQFPRPVTDDRDIDDVVEYLATHRRIAPEVQAAELPDRALLVEYQRKRDAARYDRNLLAVLRVGHQLGVPARSYGTNLGLPSRAAVHNRRIRLLAASPGRQAQVRATPASDRLDQWLGAKRTELRAASEFLVEQRDALLALLHDDADRQRLAEAVDQVGERMTARPTRGLAAAIAYAAFLLRPEGPAVATADAVLQEGLHQAHQLRLRYNEVRPAVAL